MAENQSGGAQGTQRGGNVTQGQPVSPPEDLPSFPDAFKVRGKTPMFRGKTRRRWKRQDGSILEWDYQHGRVEMYNSHGKHLGEYDPDTGAKIGEADPSRTVEP